jgi:Ferritin-like domain
VPRVAAELTRGDVLRAAGRGGAALALAGTGLGAFVASADATPPNSSLGALPAGDLAYARLLIATELLSIDFYGHAIGSGHLDRRSADAARLAHANEQAHYAFLARAMVAAGQPPLTAAGIDFSYPAKAFDDASSVLDLAITLETLSMSACLGAAGGVATPGLAGAIAQIAVNEAQHRTVLAATAHADLFRDAFPRAMTIEEASNALDAYTS